MLGCLGLAEIGLRESSGHHKCMALGFDCVFTAMGSIVCRYDLQLIEHVVVSYFCFFCLYMGVFFR